MLAANNRNVFLGADLFQILSENFTINIDLVLDYFERDRGAETRV